jgi:adenine-specific DNA-methyltransferase
MPTLEWIGKDKVINHHQDVPYRVLEHKYGFINGVQVDKVTASGNKIIHGDNLEALKSLLPEYEGRIKCIYIDPPYNTGNEGWVYNDNVNHPKLKKWLGEVVGKEGEDLSRHDKWLCMMYPRLKLLHKLLAADGFLFVSLDDNEMYSMKFLLNEIFGERNFQANIIVQSNKRGQTYKALSKTHEYLLCYSKSEKASISEIPIEVDDYPYEDTIGRFSIRELRNRNPKFGRFNRPNLFYPIYVNINQSDMNGFSPVSTTQNEEFNFEVLPFNSKGDESCWRWSKDKLEENKKNIFDTSTIAARQKQDGSWGIYEKYRKTTVKVKTIWDEIDVISERGTTELRKIGLGNDFQFPKPVDLIKKVLLLLDDPNAIILDSFAGSGTTAHAVLKLNKEDSGNRKFILIEMEDYAEAVTAERVKRVIEGYADVEGTGGAFDYYELGDVMFTAEDKFNENIDIETIREYVFYTDTRQPLSKDVTCKNPYYLGNYNNCDYYFYFEKGTETILNYNFLATIDNPADQYVIYADKCSLDEEELLKKNITFKKIPRDIMKF